MTIPTRLRAALVLPAFLLALAAGARGQTPLDHDYLVFVVCESADKIVLLRYGPQGARVEREFISGAMPTDLDGPHGVVVSPDKDRKSTRLNSSHSDRSRMPSSA